MRPEHAAIGALAMLLFAPLAAAQEAPAAPPDLEFLEYPGSLVREGDAWVDPADLRDPIVDEPDRIADDNKAAPAAPEPRPQPQQKEQ